MAQTVLEAATSPLVTRDILKSELDVVRSELQVFRSEMCRALIQGGVIVTLNAAIMTAIVTLATAFGG